MDNGDGYFERRRNDDDYNNNIGINMNINMNKLNIMKSNNIKNYI